MATVGIGRARALGAPGAATAADLSSRNPARVSAVIGRVGPRLHTSRTRDRFALVGRHHGLPLLLYLALAGGLTWPLVRDFGSRPIGDASGDPRHSVWMLWHAWQWAQGRDGFATSHLVYAPHGTSLLTDGVGPLSGLVSLPFWPWGPSAAYNGVILLGVWLTGYCMYVLGRALDYTVPIAFFSGVVYQTTPVHLAGVFGHMEKTFTGFLPLAILALHMALDPRRSRRWALAVGGVTVAVASYSGYQFVYAALGLTFWSLALLWAAPAGERRDVLGRVALSALAAAALTAPFLLTIWRASEGTNVRVNVTSPYYAPDVTQFVLPSFYQRSFEWIRPHLESLRLVRIPYDQPNGWYGSFVETSVTIPFSALLLCGVALWRAPRAIRSWILFTGFGLVLMLGPTLRVWGKTTMTDFDVPIVLPYAFLASLPGLEFMRVSGRFGMLAWVGLAMVAAAGLARIGRRWPQRANAVVVGATVLLLVEGWPAPWPQATLPPVPNFYREIERESEPYAVLDLPAAFGNRSCARCWPELASVYQMYQMTHRKAIAWGYFSHTDVGNISPALQSLVHHGSITPPGAPPVPGGTVRRELAAAGYRYIVWHTTVLQTYGEGGADQVTAQFIADVFGPDVRPVHEDALVRVYEIR